MIKRVKFYLFVCLALVALVPVVWLSNSSGINSANAALAEYQIEKMTCGSCVQNIEKALTKLKGVGTVEVNLTSNRGRVTFDPEIIDSQSIAEVISQAGYPASLNLELSPKDYAALQQEQSQLGQQYVARIGDRLLARSDFEKLVRQRSGKAVPTDQENQVWKTVWQEVLQRELLLAAAEKNQVIVHDGEVDARMDQLQQSHQGLEQMVLERYGDMAGFRKSLREDMIIDRNLEDHVYAGTKGPQERLVKLRSWYAGLQKNTEVIIFDPRLKTANQGGCGGACCKG